MMCGQKRRSLGTSDLQSFPNLCFRLIIPVNTKPLLLLLPTRHSPSCCFTSLSPNANRISHSRERVFWVYIKKDAALAFLNMLQRRTRTRWQCCCLSQSVGWWQKEMSPELSEIAVDFSSLRRKRLSWSGSTCSAVKRLDKNEQLKRTSVCWLWREDCAEVSAFVTWLLHLTQ